MSIKTKIAALAIASLTVVGGLAATSNDAHAKWKGHHHGHGFGYGIAAILSNIISGQSKDLFGSYNTAFIIVAILAAVGAVIAITLMKPPKHS